MTIGGGSGRAITAVLVTAMFFAAGSLAVQEAEAQEAEAQESELQETEAQTVEAQQGAEDAGTIHVELNRLDSNGEACQPYLVFENNADYALSDLRLDLVLFDTDGIVADRMAINAAPLPAGKTSLIVFTVNSMPCEAVGRILVNDVIACAGGPASAEECLDLVTTATRVDVPLFK